MTRPKFLPKLSLPIIVLISSAIAAMVAMELIGIKHNVATENVFKQIMIIKSVRDDVTELQAILFNVQKSTYAYTITQDAKYIDTTHSMLQDINRLLEVIDKKSNDMHDSAISMNLLSSDLLFHHDYQRILTSIKNLSHEYNGYVQTSENIDIEKLNSIHFLLLDQVNHITLQLNNAVNVMIINARKHLDDQTITTIIGSIADFSLILFVIIVLLLEYKKRGEHEKFLERIVYYDNLTGLPNRRFVFSPPKEKTFFKKDTTSLQRYSLLALIDIDEFSKLNEIEGPKTADIILTHIGTTIMRSLKLEVDSIARIGGDEFLIWIDGIADNIHEAQTTAVTISEQITRAVNENEFVVHGDYTTSRCKVSVCVGTTIVDKTENAMPDTIIQQADIALFNSRSTGTNSFSIFNEGMRTFIEYKINSETEIKNAIVNNKLDVGYHPIIQNDKVIGAEALVRWPAHYSDYYDSTTVVIIADKMGYGSIMEYNVLTKVCESLEMWIKENQVDEHFFVSINVSKSQLHDTLFVDNLLKITSDHNIPLSRIRIELDQQSVHNKLSDSIQRLFELKELGIVLILDDFGSGITSISDLMTLPIHQFKIDRHFINDLIHSGEGICRNILKVLYDTSNVLNVDVIVEGVEHTEQLNVLNEIGFDTFQGFLFGQVVNREQFIRLYINNHQHLSYKGEGNDNAIS